MMLGVRVIMESALDSGLSNKTAAGSNQLRATASSALTFLPSLPFLELQFFFVFVFFSSTSISTERAP